jgi:hypothetical protein
MKYLVKSIGMEKPSCNDGTAIVSLTKIDFMEPGVLWGHEIIHRNVHTNRYTRLIFA